jgi:hypothetical protein
VPRIGQTFVIWDLSTASAASQHLEILTHGTASDHTPDLTAGVQIIASVIFPGVSESRIGSDTSFSPEGAGPLANISDQVKAPEIILGRISIHAPERGTALIRSL